jgi:hypothetical protein
MIDTNDFTFNQWKVYEEIVVRGKFTSLSALLEYYIHCEEKI